ncbi:MAG: DUF1552 domain-containing protein [Acidobacteria bacterium]|nr:DUF1552 domain-containing protein [Acidobacteriota bacterium]
MIVTKKHVSRRTVIRGLGATMALPLLDAMVPAFRPIRLSAASPTRRLATVYVPNGIIMEQWTPSAEGAGFDLPPTLAPLAPYRDDLLVLTGLVHQTAYPLPGEGAGDHARAAACYLTGVHPKKTEGADIRAGVSMDQIAAQHVGSETQLASLELGCDPSYFLGACDAGYSCAYGNTLSWRTETTPLPVEINPRAVFERMFGDAADTSAAARQRRIQEDRSILDALLADVRKLQGSLGAGDREKVAQYVDAVRDVERRIQKAEQQGDRELPVLEKPSGIPDRYEDHVRMMFDLQVLAFQTDMTRVSTFIMSREVSSRTYPELGIPDPHHPISHHQDDPAKIGKLAKINAFHISLFAHFLERLRATEDGEGSLLDHAMISYGCGISDSNQHLHDNLPILVAGGGGGRVAGGRHLRFVPDTPMTNLLLTLLDKMDVPVDNLGDSTGQLRELSELA